MSNWYLRCLAALVVVGAVFTAGAGSAAVVLEWERIAGRLGLNDRPVERTNVVETYWRTLDTAVLSIERMEVDLGNPDGSGTGGAIESFGDTLLYASANGHLATLDMTEGTLEYLDLRVPMNYDHVRQTYFRPNPQFNQNWYRVHDLLIVPSEGDPNEGTLYVNHHFFDEPTLSMCNTINRRPIRMVDGKIDLSQGDWEEIYRLNKCFDMPADDWTFEGHLSGGRMVAVGQDALLFNGGEFGVGTFRDRPEEAQADSGTDYSKIVRLDLKTLETSYHAYGFRNAQGLAWDNDGGLWEAEHGAQGGDEVNYILEGENYGWPNVSYGTDYGAPRRPLKLNPIQGRHDGFRPPMYSFVPSVGLSNLVFVPRDGKGYHEWKDDILATSLKGETLWRMRVEPGPRIAMAEPIILGERLRDIIQMENGRFAILTGAHTVIFLRDPKAEQEVALEAPPAPSLVVSGYDNIAILEASGRQMEAEYPWGQLLYQGACASCHRLDGTVGAAPPLNGIIGRVVGTYTDYPYSDVLSSSRKRWTKSRVNRFIQNPEAEFSGSYMAGLGHLESHERRAIIDFLANTEPGVTEAVEAQTSASIGELSGTR
ncbi:MAG: PQQ-dependent sugar dehydrogenase [Pseudomonadota bacterium]